MRHLNFSAAALCVVLTACGSNSDVGSQIEKTANSAVSAVTSPANYSSFAQQEKAQKIVTQAIEAAGGLEALNKLASGTLNFQVQAARIGQAPTPEANGELGNPSKTTAYYSEGLVSIDRFNGENLGSRYVHGGLVDWIHFVGNNTLADVEPVLAGGIINQANTSAHNLLLMNENSQSLRYAGQVTENGQSYDAVSFVNSLGQMQTAQFDKATNLLHSVQSLAAHQQWGDIAISREFGDYKTLNGVNVAHTVTTKQADIIASVVTLDSSVDAAPKDVFETQEAATVNDSFTAPSSAPRDLEIETLANGLYFIPNAAQGYNVIFADHDDGILILETPQSMQTSRDVIRTIREKFPNKLIKGAVPTHHHFDHSGGIYGYHEAGVPILTTPGNVKFAKDIGTAPRNIGSSKGAIDSPQVASFEGRATHGSGVAAVELIDVGPNPHAEEIVMMLI